MFVDINQAVQLLKSNQIVALPTETVYGMAGNAFSHEAIASIYQKKQRPSKNPLILHLSSTDCYRNYTKASSDLADKLIEAFWPGPLTLILPQKNILPAARANLDTVALRSPKHDIFQEVLAACDFPLVAPSANPYTHTSPTSAEQVQDYFPELPILDGGECEVGLESTTLLIQGENLKILRPGLIDRTNIEECLKENKYSWIDDDLGHVSPGTDKQHYRPGLPLILALNQNLTMEQLLQADKKFKKVLALELPKDSKQANSQIYKQLWLAGKETQYDYLFVNIYDLKGDEWKPLTDRLKRAASFIF